MKKKTIIITLMVISILLSLSFSGCIHKQEAMFHDGQRRLYKINIPSNYDPSKLYPLVFVFHGGGGNADSIEENTNFSQKAEDEEFIVVYPYGTGKLKKKILTWNCGFCCGYALENDIDDIGFIEKLYSKIKKEYSINTNMVYATGLSNGGIMSYRVGAELSDIFAAIAPVAAQIGGQSSLEEELFRIPEPDQPVSVIAFNGMNDSRVPYDGGRPDNLTHTYSWMSTNESISFWVKQNQCNSIPQRNISESGNIIIDTFTQGKNNTEVTLVTIVNGKHTWPGGEKLWDGGGEPIKEISATDMIWDFFKTHQKSNNS